MKKKDLTKTLFVAVCVALNAILKLKPPIDVEDSKATKAKLEEEIKGVVSLLTEEDELDEQTMQVLDTMGLEYKCARPDAEVAGDGDDSGVTTEALEAAVENLNDVIKLKPPIETSSDEQMTNDIVEVGTKVLRDSDEVSEETRALIATLTGTEDTTPTKGSTKKANPKPKNTAGGKKGVAPPKKVGVIAFILTSIIKAKKKGITKDEILAALCDQFPDREEASMKKTVQAQVGGKKSPTRMEREKKVEFNISDKGKISLAA